LGRQGGLKRISLTCQAGIDSDFRFGLCFLSMARAANHHKEARPASSTKKHILILLICNKHIDIVAACGFKISLLLLILIK